MLHANPPLLDTYPLIFLYTPPPPPPRALVLLYAHSLDMYQYDQLLFPVTVTIQSPYIHKKALYVHITQRIQVPSTTYRLQVSNSDIFDEISSHCDISSNVSGRILDGIPSPPPPTSPVPSLAQSLMDSLASMMPLALMSGPAAGLPIDYDHAHVHDPDPDSELCLSSVPLLFPA